MKWPFVSRHTYDVLSQNFDGVFGNYKSLIDEKSTFNQEINRLNQELLSELNSHKKTKNLWHESQEHADRFLDQIRLLEKELEETKKQNQQRLDAYNTLNHKYRSLAKELEETKDALKIAQEDLIQNQMELFSSDLRINKAKESISKVRGTLRQIAKKL